MPGLDGMPAAAYKKLDIAVGIFHSVAMSMSSPNGATELVEAYSDRCADDCHDFNASLLCCLPKKAAGTDAEHGDFYTGDSSRPLALVNIDNRIIASAARLTWEPILNDFISSYQQGFLKGRQMLITLQILITNLCLSVSSASAVHCFFSILRQRSRLSHMIF